MPQISLNRWQFAAIISVVNVRPLIVSPILRYKSGQNVGVYEDCQILMVWHNMVGEHLGIVPVDAELDTT